MDGRISGLTILQSGQPYSVIDYTGAVGSIFYGVNDGITNPVVPLGAGCTPKRLLPGHSGANPLEPALESELLHIAAARSGSYRERGSWSYSLQRSVRNKLHSPRTRNIFRQPWQKRGDISIVKTTRSPSA